jgi:hypothetical protein
MGTIKGIREEKESIPIPKPLWVEVLEERIQALEERVQEAERKLDDIGSDSSPSGGFRINE